MCTCSISLWGFAQLISMTVILWPKLQKLSMTHCQTSQADWQLKYKMRKDLIQTLDFVCTSYDCMIVHCDYSGGGGELIDFFLEGAVHREHHQCSRKAFLIFLLLWHEKKSVGVIFHSFNASQNLMRSWAEKDHPGLLIIVGWFILKMFSLIIAVIFYKH